MVERIVDLIEDEGDGDKTVSLSGLTLSCLACGGDWRAGEVGELTLSSAPVEEADVMIEWTCPACGEGGVAVWNGWRLIAGRWGGDTTW